MKLSDKEAQLLGNLYESETYRVFKKHFLTDRQLEIAENTPFAQTMDRVLENRGRIMELKEMDSNLGKIYKARQKREK